MMMMDCHRAAAHGQQADGGGEEVRDDGVGEAIHDGEEFNTDMMLGPKFET